MRTLQRIPLHSCHNTDRFREVNRFLETLKATLIPVLSPQYSRDPLLLNHDVGRLSLMEQERTEWDLGQMTKVGSQTQGRHLRSGITMGVSSCWGNFQCPLSSPGHKGGWCSLTPVTSAMGLGLNSVGVGEGKHHISLLGQAIVTMTLWQWPRRLHTPDSAARCQSF